MLLKKIILLLIISVAPLLCQSDTNKVIVTFSQPMMASTVLDKANYTIYNEVGNVPVYAVGIPQGVNDSLKTIVLVIGRLIYNQHYFVIVSHDVRNAWGIRMGDKNTWEVVPWKGEVEFVGITKK